MLSFQVKFSKVCGDRRIDGWTDPLTDRETKVQQYAPDLSMLAHKNLTKPSKN